MIKSFLAIPIKILLCEKKIYQKVLIYEEGHINLGGRQWENRLRWFRHMKQIFIDDPVRQCDYETDVQRKIERGRPSKT